MPSPEASTASPADGGCLCGAIRYRVTGVPLAQSRCHCRTCRLAVGSAGVAWVIVERKDFTMLIGTLSRFTSSPTVIRTFCPVCGTSIGYEPSDAPSQIEITTATFDYPERFPPRREVWVSERVSWHALDPSLMPLPNGRLNGKVTCSLTSRSPDRSPAALVRRPLAAR